MALRLQCPQCNKRILVDEAFAGGVCRCAHCKSLVRVPGKIGQAVANGPRPEVPGGGGQTSQAGEVPAKETAEVQGGNIPTARAPRIPGVLAVVLVGGLLVIAAVVVAVLLLQS